MDDSLADLNKERELMLQYVKLKIDVDDLHAAIDGLMDIREIDAVRALLEKWQKKQQLECIPAQGA